MSILRRTGYDCYEGFVKGSLLYDHLLEGVLGVLNDSIPLSLALGLTKKRLMSYRAGADT
jgi:hypothetical protein